MPSDRFHAGNGPKRQHQTRCCSLSLPFRAHLGLSHGFMARYASSKAAAAPVCVGGYAINPSESGGAGEMRPTLPHNGVEPINTRADVPCDPFPGSVLRAAAVLREHGSHSRNRSPLSFTDFTALKSSSLTPDGRTGREPASVRRLLGV